MQLSARSEYALLALIHLARQEPGTFVSVETIAEAQGIPARFLEQIMLALRNGHYVRSAKGRLGGYCLAKPSEAITLAEVIRLFDGALAPTESVSKYFYGPTPIEQEKGLVEVFYSIRNQVAERLENTTIADVC